MTRRKIFRYLLLAVVVFGIVTGFSLTRYVLAHPNDPLQQNVASWARNKGMGIVVDKLETWLHNDPPAVAPTDTLALLTDDSTIAPQNSTTSLAPLGNETTTTHLGKTTPAVERPVIATQSCSTPTTTGATGVITTSTTTTSSTTTTTSTVVPGITSTTSTTLVPRPADIAPFISPGIKSEGEWAATARVRKKPMVYVSSIRPLWCFGSVVATMAAYNPSLVHTALFNGTEMPGGKGWKNTSKIKGKALPSLIASFNGGFRFEHEPGGYVTEGKTVQRMRKGFATFGIRADGSSTIGIWGKDMTDDGSWKSLRQNLPPLVNDAKSVYANYPSVNWGEDYTNKIYNYRSAACLRTDGYIMFVAVGKVNIKMLADTLVVLGCKVGMELDINGTWPFFATYSEFGKSARKGRIIDTRMGDPDRHLTNSTKDFFALFDPQTLPSGAVK
jgi:hypothetical protein